MQASLPVWKNAKTTSASNFMVTVSVLVTILVVVFLLVLSRERRRQADIKKARAGDSVEDFVSHFEKDGIPSDFSRKVYEFLQGLLSVKSVPIRPSDDIEDMLGIGSVGGVLLDEVVEEILVPMSRPMPTRAEMDQYMSNHQWKGDVDGLVRMLFSLSGDQDFDR